MAEACGQGGETERFPVLAREVGMTARAVFGHAGTGGAEACGGMPTFTILRHVLAAEGCNQKELAWRVGIAGSTLTRHLDRMAARGFIERVPDPHDRRRFRVVATETGRKADEAYRARMSADHEQLLDGVSPEDYATVLRVLGRVRSNLNLAAECE